MPICVLKPMVSGVPHFRKPHMRPQISILKTRLKKQNYLPWWSNPTLHGGTRREMAGTWHQNHRNFSQEALLNRNCKDTNMEQYGANPKPKHSYGVSMEHNGFMVFQDFLTLGSEEPEESHIVPLHGVPWQAKQPEGMELLERTN